MAAAPGIRGKEPQLGRFPLSAPGDDAGDNNAGNTQSRWSFPTLPSEFHGDKWLEQDEGSADLGLFGDPRPLLVSKMGFSTCAASRTWGSIRALHPGHAIPWLPKQTPVCPEENLYSLLYKLRLSLLFLKTWDASSTSDVLVSRSSGWALSAFSAAGEGDGFAHT